MKKLLIILLTLGLAIGACASETSNTDLGATIGDLATQAEGVLGDADLDPQLANAVQVVADNATTVGLAATGGEVSSEDIDALTGALADYEVQLEATRALLDPEVEDQLDSIESGLRDALSQLTG